MKKKSLALAAIAVLMVASLATAVTLAYFTDTKTATNTFTVGNVKISLFEPSWDVDENGSMKANPGVAVAKDPYVTNDGDNEAYVRLIVTIDGATAFQAAAEKYGITDLATIFGGHNTAITNVPQGYTQSTGDWTRVGDGVSSGNTLTYVYNYNKTLAKNEATKYLFTSVQMPAKFTNADVKDLNGRFTITVKAEAIQADSFVTDDNGTAAAKAFAALTSQGATEANP